MPTTEYCLYNETRSSCLTTRVTVIDAQSEPLKAVKALIEGLEPATDSSATPALWLNPLKSVPSVPRLSPYDLVYLDHQGRVVKNIELVPDDEAPRFDGRAASALVLPIHSFNASGSATGDRVLLRPALQTAPAAPAPVPALHVAHSLAPAFSAALLTSLPLETASSETSPVRAWASAFTANPFMPGKLEKAELEKASLESNALETVTASAPRVWPSAAQPVQAANVPSLEQPTPQAKSLIDFHLLRSIARLRIGLQFSISLEPAKAQSAAPAERAESNTVPLPQERRPLRLALALNGACMHAARFAGSVASGCTTLRMAAATRLRQATHTATARFIFSQKRIRIALRHATAHLTDRCAFFSTVTLPIFFEHTLPTAASRSRRSLVRLYSSSRKIYLQWADALFEAPRTASISHPPRRPPVSVRHIEARRDPVRQMLRPRS